MFSGIEAKFDENKKIYIYIFHPSPQIYSSFLEEKNFGKFRRKIKKTNTIFTIATTNNKLR